MELSNKNILIGVAALLIVGIIASMAKAKATVKANENS
jgi:hypothetical protein